MFVYEFKPANTAIAFHTFARIHEKNTVADNIITLSHKHKSMEILTVLSGKARFCIDMEYYDVKKGDVIIISPYMIHNATLFSDSDFKHYCLCFDMEIIPDGKLGNQLEKRLAKPECIIRSDNKISTVLSECIQNAFEAHRMKKDGWELAVIGNLSVFFSLLKANGLIDTKYSYDTTRDMCCRICDYIEENYRENLSSSDAAAAMCVSKSYFCRIFKKIFGSCFQNYMCMYKIEKAKILLATTEMSVSEIALYLGFNSFSYFSKMFRQYTSVTPSQYKKQQADNK